jgi:hypothetical protein
MTAISDYLKSLRQARGHDTPAKMAKYAKTRGLSITAQALRNFENNEKIPNVESRTILGHVLHLNEESKHRVEVLCAHSDIAKKWGHLDLFVIDDLARSTISRELARVALPDDATRDEIIEAAKRIEQCLTRPKTQT